MKVLYYFNRKGDGLSNEDVCGFTSDAAWVIDGATDVFKQNAIGKDNEVQWYVRELQRRIYNSFISDEGEILDVMQQSVKGLYNELLDIPGLSSVPIYKLPTFTIASVRIVNDNVLKYYILGDSSIAYYHNKELVVLTDTRLSKYSLINRRKLKENKITSKNISVPFKIFQEIRQKANAPDGYPIGTIDGSGLYKGYSGEVCLSQGDRVIVYSDGFKDFFYEKPQEIYEFFDTETIEKSIERMYVFLSNPEEYDNNPRPKKIDDASLILLEI